MQDTFDDIFPGLDDVVLPTETTPSKSSSKEPIIHDIIPSLENPSGGNAFSSSTAAALSSVESPLDPALLIHETQLFISRLQELVASASTDFTTTTDPQVGPYSQPTNPGFLPIRLNTIRQFRARERIREQRTEQGQPKPFHELPASDQEQPAATEAVSSPLLYDGVRDSQKTLVISQEEKEELLEAGRQPPRYSKSVQLQNKKISEIYQSFISQMDELDDYPITAVAVVAFLTWLERSKRFCPRSIDDVVWPALCRLNILHGHEHITPYTQSCARAKIAEIYRNPDCKKSPGGMLPLIPDDIARIIQALPKQSTTTAKLASLFLFAISTGARGG